MTRRTKVLLALLGVVLAYASVDFYVRWREAALLHAEPRIDPATLTIEQLIEGVLCDAEDASPSALACVFEIKERGWREGPAAVEAAFAHPNVTVRQSFLWLGFLPQQEREVPDEMVRRWRDRFLRVLAEDEDELVQVQVAMTLAILVREERLRETPPVLVGWLRRMIASPTDWSRQRACMVAFQLRGAGAALLDDLFAMDLQGTDEAVKLRWSACLAVGYLGTSDPRAQRYLLQALQDDDVEVREVAANGLGRVGIRNPEVIDALLARWRDEQEGADVRCYSLESLAALSVDAELAQELLAEVRSACESLEEQFSSRTRWLRLVVEFALRADDRGARETALRGLRELSPEQGDDPGWCAEIAVPGGVARLAAAQRDARWLTEVMPPLLEELEDTTQELDDAVWRIRAPSRRLALEGLVDICLWQGDAILRARVREALQAVVARQPSEHRDWAREQLARLQGK